jgi:hypothetical protein
LWFYSGVNNYVIDIKELKKFGRALAHTLINNDRTKNRKNNKKTEWHA